MFAGGFCGIVGICYYCILVLGKFFEVVAAMPHGKAVWMWVGIAVVAGASANAQSGPAWPSARDNLLFAFTDAQETIFARGPDGAALFGYALTPRGKARTDAHGRLLLQEGAYVAQHIGETVVSAIEAADAFTLEAHVTPAGSGQADAAIVVFGGLPPEGNFALYQDGLKLHLLLTTSEGAQDLELFKLGGSAHVAVVYNKGTIAAYCNGEKKRVADVSGKLSNWEPGAIVLGAATAERGRDWAGILEGIALYDAALGPETVRKNAEAFQAIVKAREPVPTLRVRATLVGKSHVPEPEELAPYTESLSVYQYSVDKVLEGEYDGETLYVAHWGVLDAEQMPFKEASVDIQYTLEVQPFDANPQLETVNIQDDIVEDYSVPWYYDAGGLSLGFGDVSERVGGK